MTTIVAIVAAFVGARALFFLIGFDYNPMTDSFDLGKMMTLVVAFVGLFLVIKWLLDKGKGSRRY